MREIKLNAKLSSNLTCVVLIFNIFFVHNFKSADPPSLFMSDKHNLSKLPFTHFFAHGKIRNFKILKFRYFKIGILISKWVSFPESSMRDMGLIWSSGIVDWLLHIDDIGFDLWWVWPFLFLKTTHLLSYLWGWGWHLVAWLTRSSSRRVTVVLFRWVVWW